MLHTLANEWGSILQSHTARLSATYGASITPGNNVYGSYATVMSAIPTDAYAISILVHDIGLPTTATDSLTTIGIDNTGGSSFSDFISHLYTSCATPIGVGLGGGIEYYFPVFIRAGSSIGAKGSINNATVGTQRVSCRLWCQPSRPDLLKTGQFVTTLGATTATSTGTTVTAGTVSEGTFTSLGTVSGPPLWYWTAACGRNSNNIASEQVALDLAIGSSTTVNKIAILEQIVNFNTNEAQSAKYEGAYMRAVAGDNIYMRLQCGSADTAFAGIAYGVGG